MCEPTTIALASLAFSGMQQISAHKNAKQQARDQQARNKEARKSSQRAYLSDLAELDRKQFKKEKDAKTVKEEKQLELIKKQDKAKLASMERGSNNVEAALRDIGFDYEKTFDSIAADVYDSNINNIFGYDNAYAAMQRSYSQIPDVYKPSDMGLAIGLAGTAVSTYGNLQGGKYGKSSASDLKADPFKGKIPGGSNY